MEIGDDYGSGTPPQYESNDSITSICSVQRIPHLGC